MFTMFINTWTLKIGKSLEIIVLINNTENQNHSDGSLVFTLKKFKIFSTRDT